MKTVSKGVSATAEMWGETEGHSLNISRILGNHFSNELLFINLNDMLLLTGMSYTIGT